VIAQAHVHATLIGSLAILHRNQVD
jgi:hypothetical protein